MPAQQMTARQRWLAALDMLPVDRLPFWPKLNVAYPPAQQEPFCSMTLPAIHEWIGSDRHEGIATPIRAVRRRCEFREWREGNSLHKLYRTPAGEVRQTYRFDGPSHSWHPVEFAARTLEHVRILTAFYEDEAWELDADLLAQARREALEIGEGALRVNGVGETALMHWVEHLAGVETAHYLLADHTDVVEALFEAMHQSMVRKAQVVAEHGIADAVYFIENTSTTLISPGQYRRYCMRQVGEPVRILRQAGRRVILHMCGALKAILADVNRLGATAFEAFTSPPVGNTRLIDGRTACPDVCLVGGTNATLWTRPAGEIIAEVRRDLDALPHTRGVVVTSGGVMPPPAAPDTIRAVCEAVKRYPPRNAE